MNLKRITSVAVVAGLSFLIIPLSASERLNKELKSVGDPRVITSEVVEGESPVTNKQVWAGINFTKNETVALSFFQDIGIVDRNALAVLMGNIKQESQFHSNICEGGARVNYHSCRSGGYGLIQWTTVSRYNHLGRYSRSVGRSPSEVLTQLKFVTQETEWKKIYPGMKRSGGSIPHYMNLAYRWIGWGKAGKRVAYSYDYHRRLVKV